MNQSPPGGRRRLEDLAAVVCDQDRGESPFGWSSPVSGVYGDPQRWSEVPAPLTAAVVSTLGGYGWPEAHATEHSVVVPLDHRARGLTAPAARGEHLYVVWGGARPEWSWATAHPNAPAGGQQALLLAPADDPDHITAQILRVLRTGRALP
ncbi:hypothetical protein ACFWXA_13150 [Streptomyces atroolivaceus]|uniref:hypothetical protein n=1 Tax=Streptomyces atroolivaceus TaxID=66869 RepID=UPI003664375E